MTTTFETARVGDKVWCMRLGWGEVTSIEPDNRYPVFVDFPNKARHIYTFEGFYDRSDAIQSLFWGEVKIEAPQKPLPKLEVDTKVIVWNRGVGKVRRHFSHFVPSGKIVCFDYGQTSWTSESTTEWNMWELAELQPLNENQ